MGRPPCCDKVGIKKGPWTPEEDIILVSYIQQHGPGLLRCSKSCRLRWTNYLRPGIKRGNFTPHEEGMIVHLQALLGNKWAAIASYLPQRTDNDIKNYWNTHLKKKLKKLQSTAGLSAANNNNSNNLMMISSSNINYDNHNHNHEDAAAGRSSRSCSSALDNNRVNQLQAACTYASSTENISRLLQAWMTTTSKPTTTCIKSADDHDDNQSPAATAAAATTTTTATFFSDHHPLSNDEDYLDSILSLDNHLINDHYLENATTVTVTTAEPAVDHHVLNQAVLSSHHDDQKMMMIMEDDGDDHRNHNNINYDDDNDVVSSSHPPLTFLEKWLLDESSAAAHVDHDIITTSTQIISTSIF